MYQSINSSFGHDLQYSIWTSAFRHPAIGACNYPSMWVTSKAFVVDVLRLMNCEQTRLVSCLQSFALSIIYYQSPSNFDASVQKQIGAYYLLSLLNIGGGSVGITRVCGKCCHWFFTRYQYWLLHSFRCQIFSKHK